MTSDNRSVVATERAVIPEWDHALFAHEVRRAGPFERAEVHAAFQEYRHLTQQAAKTGDWDSWAAQFTEDAIYVDHHHGVIRGRSAIRKWITNVTRGSGGPDRAFPAEFYVVDNDLVLVCCSPRHPAADGRAGEPFAWASILCYAGERQWCYQEDIYGTGTQEYHRIRSLPGVERAD